VKGSEIVKVGVEEEELYTPFESWSIDEDNQEEEEVPLLNYGFSGSESESESEDEYEVANESEGVATPPQRSPDVSDDEDWEKSYQEWLDLYDPDNYIDNPAAEQQIFNLQEAERVSDCLYAPVVLKGGRRKDFLVDSGAANTCIDEHTYFALPDPKPRICPTNVKFRVANGNVIEPWGVIHLPIRFDDGTVNVSVTVPAYVCKLSRKGRCVLGSDAATRLRLKLDWANQQLVFPDKYSRLPLNCHACRSDQPAAYQARVLNRVKIPANSSAGITVGTRASMPPLEWRHYALAESTEELYSEHGCLAVTGFMDFTKGPAVIRIINNTDFDAIIRRDTAILDLCSAEKEVESTQEYQYKEMENMSIASESSLEGVSSLFNIVGKKGEEPFTREESRQFYNLFAMEVPESPFGEASIPSTTESLDDSMDIINYPDIEPSIAPRQGLSETLVKLLGDSKEGLEANQVVLVEQLIEEMQTSFMDPSQPLQGTSAVFHYIETGDRRPIRIPPRRVSPGKRDIIEKEVEKMLNAGVIRPSNSPWSSPIVIVKKADGTNRFCIDYRKLNDVTRKNSYPLPRIDDHLEALRGKKWFCTLDLASGYWQVKMHEGDKEKTAFCSHMGLYEFNVMPFGLTNAPATFQTLMEEVLSGLIGDACLLYLDDIIVFGDTFEEVYDNLRQVMSRVAKYNLKLKAKKCSLFKRSVKFLGHIVSAEGIACNPETVKAVTDIIAPEDKSGVRSILGLGNYYRRFIKDYCLLVHPMQKLTHLKAEFIWGEEQQKSLEDLKTALVTAPILAYPDLSEGRDLIVDTDASDYQIGGVLSQVQDKEERVIMYASKGFHGAQMNWCTTKRELWAIVYMTSTPFRYYIEGRDFLVRTDHSSLQWIDSFPKNSNTTICRWIFFLSKFRGHMKVQHRAGKKHGNADAMSRIRAITRPCPIPGCGDPGHLKDPPPPKDKKKRGGKGKRKEKTPEEPSAVICTESAIREDGVVPVEVMAVATPDLLPVYDNARMLRAQAADPQINRFLEIFAVNESKPPAQLLSSESTEVRTYCNMWKELKTVDGILYRHSYSENDPSALRLVVPARLREDIMQRMHDSKWAGHPGMSRMKHALLSKYYWPRVGKDIEAWIRCCESCIMSKRGPHRSKHPLEQEISGAPFHRVAFDMIGPLPESDLGNRHILLLVDYFTKWAEAYALPERVAITVADVIVKRWFASHGIPLKLHCDNAAEFRSKVMRELKEMLGVKGTFITPYRPKSNGLAEKTNGTAESMIMCLIREERKEWDTILPFVMAAYRATPHSTTGFTPNMMVHGRESNLPCDIMYGNTTLNTGPPEYQCYCEYVSQLRHEMIRSHEIARRNAKVAAVRQKRVHDENTAPRKFRLGDVVWFFEKRLSSRPLCMGWTGKFVITDQPGSAVYRIQRVEGGKSKVVHVDNLRLHSDQSEENWVKVRLAPPEKGVQTQVIVPLVAGITRKSKEDSDVNPLLRRSERIAKRRKQRRSSESPL